MTIASLFLTMFFLWLIFYSLVNSRQLTAEGGNSTSGPTESHHVPTLTGVIITMVLGTLCIFLTIIPLCLIKQEEEFKYDPSKPLLGNAPVD